MLVFVWRFKASRKGPCRAGQMCCSANSASSASPRPERQDKRHASLSSRRIAHRIDDGLRGFRLEAAEDLECLIEPAGKRRRDQIEGVVAAVVGDCAL
ncbi:MAG: hypothetical protein ACT4QB_15950 [Gammaproteobacteria bacterium]